MVLPNPARVCDGAASSGETRVKGSLAIPATVDDAIDEEELLRDDDAGEPVASADRKGRPESRELFTITMAGSNVHSSHLSNVVFVSPPSLAI